MELALRPFDRTLISSKTASSLSAYRPFAADTTVSGGTALMMRASASASAARSIIDRSADRWACPFLGFTSAGGNMVPSQVRMRLMVRVMGYLELSARTEATYATFTRDPLAFFFPKKAVIDFVPSAIFLF